MVRLDEITGKEKFIQILKILTITYILVSLIIILNEVTKPTLNINTDKISDQIWVLRDDIYSLKYDSSEKERRDLKLQFIKTKSEIEEYKTEVNKRKRIKNREQLEEQLNELEKSNKFNGNLLELQNKRQTVKYLMNHLKRNIMEGNLEDIEVKLNEMQIIVLELANCDGNKAFNGDLLKDLLDLRRLVEYKRTGRLVL